MTIGGYEDSLCYEIDRLQADLDKDEEYIEKLEEKNQRLEYLASKAEALEESNHKKDQEDYRIGLLPAGTIGG